MRSTAVAASALAVLLVGCLDSTNPVLPKVEALEPSVNLLLSLNPAHPQVITAGGAHACTLMPGGKVFCWGGNASGQLGVGDYSLSWRPLPVDTARVFRALSAGTSHTCAVDAAGNAYCWGSNSEGQLGDNSLETRNVPTAVSADSAFRSISAGDGHTCALTAGGRAYCWGSNAEGQLGDSTQIRKLTPVAVAGVHTFRAISVGGSRSCGIATDGRALCWGGGGSNGIGDGSTERRLVPTHVGGDLRFQSVSVGTSSTCAVTERGQAFCWGSHQTGTLGTGWTAVPSLAPTAVSGRLTFRSISTHTNQSCAVAADGKAYCWGSDFHGVLGYGGRTYSSTRVPNPVGGARAFRSISSGLQHTCGLATDNRIFCWGAGREGRLGTGLAADSLGKSAPVEVSPEWLAVAAVSVTPGRAGLHTNLTHQLAARVTDASGRQLIRRVVWTSSDTLVARVDSLGLVTGVSVGTASIRATVEGRSGAATVTVAQATPEAEVNALINRVKQLVAEKRLDGSRGSIWSRQLLEALSWIRASTASGVAFSVREASVAAAIHRLEFFRTTVTTYIAEDTTRRVWGDPLTIGAGRAIGMLGGFTATLSADSVMPPPGDSVATGTAKFAVMGNRVDFQITVTNLTNATAVQIRRPEEPDSSKQLLVTLPVTRAGTFSGVLAEGFFTAGSSSLARGMTADSVIALMRGGAAVVDVRTRARPNGAILGRIRPQ